MEISKQESGSKESDIIKKIFFSSFLLLFFLFCTISFSLIIEQIAKSDWAASKYFSESFFDFFVIIFPVYLLFLYFIFYLFSVLVSPGSLIFINLSWSQRTLILFFLSIIFGIMLFYGGVSSGVSLYLSNFNTYKQISEQDQRIWLYPEFGLLAGDIGRINSLEDFLLIDLEGKVWKIDAGTASIKDVSIIESGNKIKLIGRIEDKQFFKATKIINYTNDSFQ